MTGLEAGPYVVRVAAELEGVLQRGFRVTYLGAGLLQVRSEQGAVVTLLLRVPSGADSRPVPAGVVRDLARRAAVRFRSIAAPGCVERAPGRGAYVAAAEALADLAGGAV